MLFVDTGAWFALSVPSDPDHARAKDFIRGNQEPLVTKNYVVDELLTLFSVRRLKSKGSAWLREVLGGGGVELVRIEPADFDAACRVYQQFVDKLWSFTDCTSYVVMRRLEIVKAFSFDDHFRQFGTVQVLPLQLP